MKRFEAQRSRGTTSFGFYLPQTNRLTHNVKETRIKNLLKRTKGSNTEVLFHHRFSTSTADVPNACHPFSTKDYFKNNYVGVHNGVLSNDDILEKQHLELGINYVSKQTNGQFNDSEALIYDIARYLEGEVDELTAKGSIAFIVIKRNKDGKATTLFFGRNNGNPLKMKKTKHSLTLSSQGEGKDIEPNKLYSYDYETGELKSRYLYIPYYSSYGSSYNYGKSWKGSLNGSYDSSGNYCRPYWDREEDEEYLDKMEQEYANRAEYEDYNGAGSWRGGNDTTTLQEIVNAGDFIPRTGTKTQIKRELLEEAGGDFNQAAIDTLAEVDDAEREEKRIDESMYTGLSGDVYDALCDYWYAINTYKSELAQIASEFEEEAVQIASKQTILIEEKSLVTA